MKMKIIILVLGIITVLFVISQLYLISSQKNIETYSYNVLKSYKNIEIRQYEANLFASIKLTTNNFKQNSSKGFSILAGYIFGGNDKKEKISMTSPVKMSLKDSTTMMFLVPKKYTKENLPIPNNTSIKFENIPAKKVAAISFGGWANDSKVESYRSKLIAGLKSRGVEYTDSFFFFGYNAPMEIFNRKNEIIVELKE